MKIVILGAGHLAYHLIEMLSINKFNIVQLYNRSKKNAEIICQSRNIPFTCDCSSIQDADIYIIATADHAIEKVSSLIQLKDALVVHTSGSSSTSVLQGNYRKGVFYPLQSFRRERALIYHEIPFFIESEKEKDTKLLMQIAGKISNFVFRTNTKERTHLHLAAVWGANFVNHCYHIAQEHCQKAQIPFSVMRPLLRETAEKIHYMSVQQAQTGPALRAEAKIIEKHLKLTKNEREKTIYRLLSESIRNYYEKL